MKTEDFSVSEAFHEAYKHLYDRCVVIRLQSGEIVKGCFCDEFYEDAAILVSTCDGVSILRIADIAQMAEDC